MHSQFFGRDCRAATTPGDWTFFAEKSQRDFAPKPRVATHSGRRIMPQSLAVVYLHLAFSTKDRRPFLRDPRVRAALHAHFKTRRERCCPNARSHAMKALFGIEAQPRWGWVPGGSFPRVARPSQPMGFGSESRWDSQADIWQHRCSATCEKMANLQAQANGLGLEFGHSEKRSGAASG